MKKYLINLFVIIVGSITVYLLGFDNADIRSFNKEEKKVANIRRVSIIISKITEHKYLTGCLPDKLEDLYLYKDIEKLCMNKRLIYKKEGIRDKFDNEWLVIISDNDFPDTLFVGNLNTHTVIHKKLIIKDSELMNTDR